MAFHWAEAARALGLQVGSSDRETLFAALKIEGGDLRERPWGWSRGMKQRFVIAMALIGRPDLIVLDEPTSALDPVVAAMSMDLLDGHLDGTRTAMMLITHDLGLAARRVSKLMVLHDGRLVEEGATEDLLLRPETAPAKALAGHRNWAEVPC